jgi:hypothetical protein
MEFNSGFKGLTRTGRGGVRNAHFTGSYTLTINSDIASDLGSVLVLYISDGTLKWQQSTVG